MFLLEKFCGLFLPYKEDSKPLFFRNPKRKVELQQYRQNQVSLDPYNQYDLIHYPLNVSSEEDFIPLSTLANYEKN